jgi:hypothetical protein
VQLVDIRVRNFRSVGPEQHVPIPGQMTLVGPNNSGKTNLLRAFLTLFTGFDNTHGYARNIDLTFGAGRSRTSIIATFDGSPQDDPEIYREIDELHQLQGTDRNNATALPLTLYFTDTSTPVYSFFPNVKRPTDGSQSALYSRTHKSLVNRLLSGFSVHYVPSAKSVEQIHDELLAPFLRREAAAVMASHVSDIQEKLDDAAAALNRELNLAGLTDFRAGFSLPNDSVERLFSGFDMVISDPTQTPIREKGMGVQVTALIAAFRWITQQEAATGRKVIWLLEEPESYLHPDLASNCNLILDQLATESIVIKTTHSMAFVPQNPDLVCGTQLNDDSRTEVIRFRTYNDAVTSIRSALGIKFADFYNLAQYNVMVEGPSDREIFKWLLEKISPQERPWTKLRLAKSEDFGGVQHLAGFLRATYSFIAQERICVAVFDGDTAGLKARQDLQHYFGNKQISFEPNRNFVSIRRGFAVEGLFPDAWIIELHSEYPSWFEDYSEDSTGSLEPFRIKDDKKSIFIERLVGRANSQDPSNWSERFLGVGDALENALNMLELHLSQ